MTFNAGYIVQCCGPRENGNGSSAPPKKNNTTPPPPRGPPENRPATPPVFDYRQQTDMRKLLKNTKLELLTSTTAFVLSRANGLHILLLSGQDGIGDAV